MLWLACFFKLDLIVSSNVMSHTPHICWKEVSGNLIFFLGGGGGGEGHLSEAKGGTYLYGEMELASKQKGNLSVSKKVYFSVLNSDLLKGHSNQNGLKNEERKKRHVE